MGKEKEDDDACEVEGAVRNEYKEKKKSKVIERKRRQKIIGEEEFIRKNKLKTKGQNFS